MTATGHEFSDVDGPPPPADELHHIMSDHSEDWSLCGRDISGMLVSDLPLPGEMVCVVCEDIVWGPLP